MTLQERLNLLKASQVPLPMVGAAEVTQAMRLHNAGMSYSTIAVAMRFYHGSTRSPEAWRSVLRARGATPRHYGRGGSVRLAPQERES